MSVELEFLFDEPAVPFRVVKRKGELRYIASYQRGSLGSMTRFAPVSKRIPKLMLKFFARIDFRLPHWVGLVEMLPVSEDFLIQAAALLEVPVERVGIYVGEPDARRKLVIADVADQSDSVLKVAVGSGADEAIRREADGGRLAMGVGHWEGLVPDIRRCEPVCGRPAILIERIRGKQLTPDEFEKAFFGEGAWHLALGAGEVSHGGTKSTESLSIEEWLNKNPMPNAERRTPLVDACRECGALDLRSPLGLVHGDFAPWNMIRREADQGTRHQASGIRYREENLAPSAQRLTPPALCAVDWEFSRADTPLVFDLAYAAWCYDDLLGRTVLSIDTTRWKQLVALGVLWKEIRKMPAVEI